MRLETFNVFVVLLVVLVLVTIFGIAYVSITSKTKIRLALIEKGMDPNLARSDFWIQVGVIAAGFCLGLIIGDLLPYKLGTYGPLLGFVFAGAGLVAYNIIKNKKAKRNSS